MLLKALRSYEVLQFHMELLRKGIIDHPDSNTDASKKYERGDDGKADFLLAGLFDGDGVQQPGGQVLGASAAGNLGILCQNLCLCCLPLSACMLAFFWLSLFSLDSGGKIEVQWLLTGQSSHLGHPQKK